MLYKKDRSKEARRLYQLGCEKRRLVEAKGNLKRIIELPSKRPELLTLAHEDGTLVHTDLVKALEKGVWDIEEKIKILETIQETQDQYIQRLINESKKKV